MFDVVGWAYVGYSMSHYRIGCAIAGVACASLMGEGDWLDDDDVPYWPRSNDYSNAASRIRHRRD